MSPTVKPYRSADVQACTVEMHQKRTIVSPLKKCETSLRHSGSESG